MLLLFLQVTTLEVSIRRDSALRIHEIDCGFHILLHLSCMLKWMLLLLMNLISYHMISIR
jgi:hypothetical protein